MRDTIISMPEHDPASRFTLTDVIQKIDKLHEKMKMKGRPCPDIAVETGGTLVLTIPPVAHVAAGATLPVQSVDSPAAEYEDAKRVTWVATNSAPLLLRASSSGKSVVAQKGATELNTGFVSSANLDIDWAKARVAPKRKNTAPVFVTTIELAMVVPIFTKDQMVVKFEESRGDIIDLKTTRQQMRALKGPSSKSKYLLVPSPLPEGAGRLNQKRLTIDRVVSMLAEMKAQGFSLGQIIVPQLDRDPPIRLESLRDNEILVKIVSEGDVSFEPPTVAAFIGESGSGGATADWGTYQRYLETYQANTERSAK